VAPNSSGPEAALRTEHSGLFDEPPGARPAVVPKDLRVLRRRPGRLLTPASPRFLEVEPRGEGRVTMVGNQAYIWPLIAVAFGTCAAAMLRCMTLFIGMCLAFRGASKKERFAIYREFCRALSFKSRSVDSGIPIPWQRSSEDDFGGGREPAGRRHDR
jgi:hypothetical protein